MNFSIKAKITVLCGVFLFLFLLSVSILMVNLRSVTRSFGDVVNDAEDIINKSHLLSKLVVDMETGQRGFVITGQDEFLKPFNEANDNFDELLENLRETFSTKAEHLDTLEKIEHLRYKWLGTAGEPEIKMRQMIKEAAFSLKGINNLIMSGKGKRILDEIRTVISAISNDVRATNKKDELILITQIGKDIVDSETGQRGFLLTGKDHFLEPYYRGQINFGKHVKELETKLVSDETNLEKITNVKSLHERWLAEAARPEINARVKYEKNPRSMDDIVKLLGKGTGKKIIDELREMTAKFTNTLTKEMKGKFSQSKRNVALTNLVSLIACCVGILSSLVLSVFTGKSIIKPISVLMNGTQKVGGGDLSHMIKISNKDEIGFLAESFNKMTDDLKNTTTSIDTLNATNQQLQFEISERKKAEKEKEKLHVQLRQSQKMEAVGTLAGGIAHDFNNILGSIIGYTDLALEDVPDGTVANDNLKQVLIAGSRAKNLVRQILTFSRQNEHQKKPVEAASVVTETLTLLRSSLPTTIETKQNIEADSSIILADSTQIHQIVMNLCTNASDAMADKKGVLEVCLTDIDLKSDTMYGHKELQAGQYVKLVVKDTGHGMDSETMERIFEPFFTTKDVDKGTGMGLAVIHGIVEEHNGTITVDSEIGKGTTFNVFFPKIESNDASEDDSSEMIGGQGEVILVVDDEKPLVDMTKQMLQRSGYTVIGKTNSVDALETFRGEPDKFDLVITDYAMPVMTGKELAKELLQIRADIPIIICTGFNDEIDSEEANNIGIKKFIMKPADRKEITGIIRNLLNRKGIAV